jgi:1-acyl-sn-glycerol-3-phosphate acyltransferase
LTVLYWIRTVFLLVPAIAIYTIVFGVISLTGGLFDGSGRFAHRVAQIWARCIIVTSGVRVDRQGELPPASESCVFVVNHASFYDVPIMFAALPRQLRLMAKAALGRVPFIGWHLMRGGHVLVNRTNPGAGIFKRMQRMARAGASLMVFPEGGRSDDGVVGKFKGGIFLLAIENGLRVVPISLDGSRLVMPKGTVQRASCPRGGHHSSANRDQRPDARRRKNARGTGTADCVGRTAGVNLTTDPALAGIVKPGWFVAEPVTVVDRDPEMDEPLRAAAAAMRARAESAETTAAVRTMYKRVGIDPTKTRPSSEALLRRVRRGDALPRINSLVDVINWCSLENATAVRPL